MIKTAELRMYLACLLIMVISYFLPIRAILQYCTTSIGVLSLQSMYLLPHDNFIMFALPLQNVGPNLTCASLN